MYAVEPPQLFVYSRLQPDRIAVDPRGAVDGNVFRRQRPGVALDRDLGVLGDAVTVPELFHRARDERRSHKGGRAAPEVNRIERLAREFFPPALHFAVQAGEIGVRFPRFFRVGSEVAVCAFRLAERHVYVNSRHISYPSSEW